MASTTQWPDVAGLPIDKPPTKAPYNNSEIPSDDDMGLNDPDNILYVNMTGPDLGAKFKDRMDELQQMLQLTHQLATIHAGIQVRRRKEEGQLPTDDSDDSAWRRAQYRARVLDTYFNDGVYTWMYSPRRNQVSKVVNIEKSRFHWQILANMLEGIVLPRPLAASLEAIFKGIADTINETRFTADRRTSGVCFKYTRMIQCETTYVHEMYTVSQRKSSMTTINVNWEFGQTDFSFNETTWKSMKPGVQKFIEDTGIGNIKDPPNVPV